MRSAVYHHPHDVRISDVAEPEPGAGEVKLRVAHNGVCGSDLHEYFAQETFVPVAPHPQTGIQAPVALGRASVLYTFYPPMIGSVFYYLGVVLVVVGSWVWVALMSINLRAWKRANPGATIPLAMFGNVAGAYLWSWTAVVAAIEILVLILPVALGFKDTIDAGLARVFFSWTLHAIVYFWLMPAYIAFYTIVPRAIGGRLYSDTMGRVAFVLFLVFSMPIGIHHLFADPHVGAGFKFLHAVFTAMVAVPTFLTVFTIVASVEIAARLRGGKGLIGWVKALPWDNPMMLAVTFSFVMLGFGGAGGIINMSYQLNETVNNTQWVTGHFHLIFAGAIVIMYFMIAYDLWPQLTKCRPLSTGLIKVQLWTWFVGMLVLTMPWHLVGLLVHRMRDAGGLLVDAAFGERGDRGVALRLGNQRLLAESIPALQLGQHHFRAADEPLDPETPRFDHVVVVALVAFADHRLAGGRLQPGKSLEELVDVRDRELGESPGAQPPQP